jgi:hypothetical protein
MQIGFWLENLTEGNHSQDPNVEWEDNIKMHLRKVGWRGMDWFGVVQDRDRWRTFVNAVMNLWVT